MSENTKLWDLLGRTDPKHTQQFKRGGGFKGTAIKPIWSYRRMTEEFGPCGMGWGVGEPTFQVVQGVNHEVLVYCTASIWYIPNDDRSRTVYGVGGDKIVTHIRANEQYNRPERWENDDEAFKKSYTDAITNALKLIGVGADVHMGMFDDSKYVNSMREEFAEEHPKQTQRALPPQNEPENYPAGTSRQSSASLKRDGAWQKLMLQLSVDFGDCKSLVTLEKLRDHYREMARNAGWPRTWLDALKNEFDSFEDDMKKHVANSEDEVFPGDKPSNFSHPIMAG